jgi:predicted transcriptional regulator
MASQHKNGELNDEVVLNYLRSKGYVSATPGDIDQTGAVEIGKFAMSVCLDGHTHDARTIRSYDEQENQPDRYFDSYKRLKEWVLPPHRKELVPLLWPVFVHFYIDLIKKGFGGDGQCFINEFFSADHRKRSKEVKSLQELKSAAEVATSQVAIDYRKKVQVTCSMFSYEELRAFLEKERLMLLMRTIILQVQFRITSSNELNDEATTLKQKFPILRWGILEEVKSIGSEALRQQTAVHQRGRKGEDEEGGDEQATKKRKITKDGADALEEKEVDDNEGDDDKEEQHAKITITIPDKTDASKIHLPNM